MGGLCNRIIVAWRKIEAIPRIAVMQPIVKSAFASCGSHFRLGKSNDLQGIQNISVGDNVSFGPETRIWTTGARVFIGNDVMFGPRVTIISGDHRIDIRDKPMRAVTPKEKLPKNDQDVMIGSDVWIGANVTILKGVYVADGSVIAAGAVVTKNLSEENCVWGGVPASLISRRFHG